MSQAEPSLLLRVYGDSLSMPRISEGIGYFDTYPELVRRAIALDNPALRVAVFNRSKGGVPIEELHALFTQDGAYLGKARADILIIQCGIVDCAPRPVPPRVKAGIGKLPTPLRWLAAKFLHYARPYLLRAGFKWRETGVEQFEAVLDYWLDKAADAVCRIYVLNIAPTTPAMEKHSPGLSAGIESFNGAIARAIALHPLATLVDVHGAMQRPGEGESPYISGTDGHHITRQGHRLYADMICALERQQVERA